MKLLILSLCTSGVMREQFIYYARGFAKYNDLYCVTNDNVSIEELHASEVLNVRYKRQEPWSYISIRKYVKITSFIKKVSPDIIFVFTPHPVNILLAHFLKKYKVLYLSHDPIPHIGMSKIDCIVRKIQNNQYYRISKKVIVAGQALVEQVMDTSKLSRSKIISIPFPIFGDYINDSIPPSERPVDLLFFGRIEPYKGLDVLIEALDYLESKPTVFIAGSGSLLNTFPKIKAVPENVCVLGYVKDDVLIGYIKKCKATVFPYYEATGTSVVCQSFYYGTPVIASNVGVFPEYVSSGGLIFKPGNARELASCIKTVLEDTKKREILSKCAKQICNDFFMMEDAEKKFQTVFESVLIEE